MQRTEDCLSALVLDQLHTRELSTLREAKARAHLVSCERCRQRFERMQLEAIRFAKEAPPLRPIEAARPLHLRLGWLAPAASTLAAAAVLVLWLQGNPSLTTPAQPLPSEVGSHVGPAELRPRGDDPQASPPRVAPAPVTDAPVAPEPAAPGVGSAESPSNATTPAPNTNRTKGAGPTLRFFVRRGDRVLDGEPRMKLFAGDELRFALGLDRSAHCGVWGREASGTLSAYAVASSLVRLEPGQGQLLEGATRLDQSLGSETLIAVCCQQPSSAESVRLALQSASVHELPGNCSQSEVTIEKVSAP